MAPRWPPTLQHGRGWVVHPRAGVAGGDLRTGSLPLRFPRPSGGLVAVAPPIPQGDGPSRAPQRCFAETLSDSSGRVAGGVGRVVAESARIAAILPIC